MRYDLTDFEWSVIEPLLPNNTRGVERVDDRRVLNGIFWALRSGAPWRDVPERYGPYSTCYNVTVRRGPRDDDIQAAAPMRWMIVLRQFHGRSSSRREAG